MPFYSDIIIVILNLPEKFTMAPGVFRDAITEVHRPIKTGIQDFTGLLIYPDPILGRILMNISYNLQLFFDPVYFGCRALGRVGMGEGESG